MIELQDFTNTDWDGMAGCERGPNGAEPKIGYFNPKGDPRKEITACVVVDGCGISVMLTEPFSRGDLFKGYTERHYNLDSKDLRVGTPNTDEDASLVLSDVGRFKLAQLIASTELPLDLETAEEDQDEDCGPAAQVISALEYLGFDCIHTERVEG